ncbi:MAG: hypothetical protein K9L62_01305 [Vallitaleaceae bacterium]|nr:hypothetical protein [Vallitaleaceae bacterium]
MGMTFTIETINKLSDRHIMPMFELMNQYYDNVKYDKFLIDLNKKHHVILLWDEDEIYGFSTLELMPFVVNDREIIGIFSGDTIVDKYRPIGLGLQMGFSTFIYQLLETETREIYWFLICKGYKTYRYMSIYFNDYYPNHASNTPEFEQAIMHSYATIKYGDAYIKETGIIMNNGENDYLKDGVAPVDKKAMLNPVNRFFIEKNPGHEKGDELVCLARFSRENLKDAFFRVIKR